MQKGIEIGGNDHLKRWTVNVWMYALKCAPAVGHDMGLRRSGWNSRDDPAGHWHGEVVPAHNGSIRESLR